MSTYDDASLIMYPSGYKEDKLYSLKPTDGSGDLTFTRASTATRVNSDGLIEGVRTNLLTYSNDFSNAAWTKTNSNITSGFTSPDGTNNAFKLTATSIGGGNIISRPSLTLNTTYVSSVYLKRISGTGNVSIFKTNGSEAPVTLTSEWQRFADVNSSNPTNAYAGVRLYGASDEILMFGFQVELGASATEYIPTTTTAVSVGMLADVPRIDYTGGGCGKLLLEPQRSNLALQSESVTTSTTNVGYTATANTSFSPDGTQNADQILEDTSTLHLVQKAFSVGSTTDTYAVSFFVKTNGRTSGKILYGLNGAPYSSVSAVFNLTAGSIAAVVGSAGTTAGTSKIENYGNGWYRISVSGVIGTAGSHYVRLEDTNGGVAGDPTKGFQVWGFQAEQGSYATSYIPTLASSVTRLADAAFKTGISSLIGSVAGTMYVEVAALANDLSERRFALSDGTTGNVARVGFTSTSNRIIAVLYNGANQCVMTYDGADITQTNKIAFTWSVNDFALFVNGVKRASDVSGTTFSANTLTELQFNGGAGAGNNMYGEFQQILLFKTRLTNDQLADLTGGNKTTFNALATFYGYQIL
jgi:hypothetical protein